MRNVLVPESSQLIRERARAMRFALTPSEQVLWRAIRGKRLGVQFRRQVPLGRCIAERAGRSEVVTPGDLELPVEPDEQMVGRHPAMVASYKTIGALSSGRAPVPPSSATGTGKALVARSTRDTPPSRDRHSA